MKIITILAALLMAIPSLKAQKQEIKKAQKAVYSGDLSSAASYLQQAKRIFAAADDKTRAHYYVVEAEMKLANKDMDMDRIESVSNSIKLAKGYNPSSSLAYRIAEMELKLKSLSAKAAVGEFGKDNFSEAAALYDVAYQSTKDTLNLLKAARSYLLAKEYNEAFRAYSNLYYMGFTDAKIRYVATNVQSKKKEAFTTSASRNTAVRQGTHKKPEIVMTNSKVPELLRGITMASIQVNNKNAAVAIIDQAVAKTPDDKVFLNQAFQLYRQLDAKNKYFDIMDTFIKETPNDPNLYYKFGVYSTQNNDIDRAKEFYNKTLSLNSTHVNAKVNLSTLLLEQEAAIIEEMDGLGISDDEKKRFEELKVKRNEVYNEVLPYLESIVASQPQNKDWVSKLMKIYSYIGQDKKLAILQEKIDD